MQNIINYSDYKEWYNKIIYAPNSTGKTRLAYEIYDKYLNNNKLLFTSKEIDNLLKISISKKKIFVGMTASKSLENELIIEELKKDLPYKNYIKKWWGVSSAKELKNISSFFNYLNVTALSLDRFFESVINNKEIDENYQSDMDISEVIGYDKKLDFDLFTEIKENVISTKFEKESLNFNEEGYFTSDELENLNRVRDMIMSKNISFCPLCGSSYSNNDELLINVNNCLSKIIVDDNPNMNKKLTEIWRKLNKKYKGNIYNVKFDKNHALVDLISYYNFCLKIYNELYANIIMNSYDSNIVFLDKKYTYINNKRAIDEEDKKFDSNLKIYSDILNEFNKLISLPSNCSLQLDDNDFVIVLEGKKVEVTNILSESEKKRLALIILKSYIENFNVDLVILDDPIDSYDDYYSEEASNYISDIIKKNNSINWVVLTHMYDFIISLSKKIKDGFELVAYFYDPTYKIKNELDIRSKTPLIRKSMLLEENIGDVEEIIMINNLFEKKDNPNDKLFVILSTFSIIRSLVREVNRVIDINYKESKVLKYTKDLESSYLHYSDIEIKTKKIVDLYKKIFKSLKKVDFTEEYINQARAKYLSLDYEKIVINNQFIKYILYMLFKIESLKYLFEYKIYVLMKSNKVGKDYLDNFCSKHELYKKIKYIKSNKLLDAIKLKEIEEIFEKYRTIINDYSHSYSRLYAPYLSANMKDVALFEYYVNHL